MDASRAAAARSRTLCITIMSQGKLYSSQITAVVVVAVAVVADVVVAVVVAVAVVVVAVVAVAVTFAVVSLSPAANDGGIIVHQS